MKSCWYGIAVTLLMLCFTGSVFADETLDSSSLNEVEAVHVEAGQVVVQWTQQYQFSVQIKSKIRTKFSGKILKQAMINKGVAGDLLDSLKKGKKIKRKHLKGCRTISAELSGCVKDFTAGRFQVVRGVLAKVEGLTELQPRPANSGVIIRRFKQIQEQPIIRRFTGSMKKWLKELDKTGSIKVGSKVKVGSVKTGSKGVTVTTPGTVIVRGSNKSKGSTGTTTTDCAENPNACLTIWGINSTTVPNVNKIDWKSIDWTVITWTMIDWTTVTNWETRINVDGTINFSGIGCTGDPGIPCYVCSSVGLVPLNGFACDDGNACTENDTCVAGICRGQQKMSPTTPCN